MNNKPWYLGMQLLIVACIGTAIGLFTSCEPSAEEKAIAEKARQDSIANSIISDVVEIKNEVKAVEEVLAVNDGSLTFKVIKEYSPTKEGSGTQGAGRIRIYLLQYEGIKYLIINQGNEHPVVIKHEPLKPE